MSESAGLREVNAILAPAAGDRCLVNLYLADPPFLLAILTVKIFRNTNRMRTYIASLLPLVVDFAISSDETPDIACGGLSYLRETGPLHQLHGAKTGNMSDIFSRPLFTWN